MSTLALNLVVVYSLDKERLSAFYRQLGLIFDLHRHGSGAEHYAAELAGGSMVFEIYPAKTGEAPTKVRLGFQVESVDALVEALRTSGATIVSEPKDSPWGRRAVIADPDGNRVELTEAIAKTE